MTQATPPDPAVSPPPTRRLLGHLTGHLAGHLAGQLPRRRVLARRAPDAPATDDVGRWDPAHGAGGPVRAVVPSAWTPHVHPAPAVRSGAAGSSARPPARPGGVPTPDAGRGSASTPPAGVDGWLTARARSGPHADPAPGTTSPTTAPPVTVPPVRVAVWAAGRGSTGSLPTGDAAPPVPVDVTVAVTAPSVVRVSAARLAPVRAPVPRTGAVAAVLPAPVPAPSSRPAADGLDPATASGTSVELVLTDGRRVPLTSTLLVGRNPAPRAGEAVGALVAVEDPARSVSKTHLTVGVDDGRVWVVDRHSTNGTVVTLPDGQRILCVPERRVRLVAGASVDFGDHGFTLAAAAEPGRPG